ncbi:hypothetical protein HK097_006252 [Rhizophlyctis rosea]|uniref:Protein kinase domain-containing protein n=1 Tax=Rhizophlyctis rosea TaxID=64517 RepID=A0AAD5SEH5_9FUNG|nr:hypothetical protein HK097_006252 [Rhizophlyctis rosea]
MMMEESPRRFAVKALPRDSADSGWREAAFMRRVGGCENVVRLEKVVEEREFVYLVMEWCEMDLYDAITTHGPFTPSLAREIFSQIITSLTHCHTRGVYHRDIKPENFLVTRDGTIKLADFGLATYDLHSSERGCGSSRYLSPEYLVHKSNPDKLDPFYSVRQSDKGDVWALGVVLINLLFGRNPWHEAYEGDAIYRAFVSEKQGADGRDVLREQFGLTAGFEGVLRRCFERDPRKRCSVGELGMLVRGCGAFVLTELEVKEDDGCGVDDVSTFMLGPPESVERYYGEDVGGEEEVREDSGPLGFEVGEMVYETMKEVWGVGLGHVNSSGTVVPSPHPLSNFNNKPYPTPPPRTSSQTYQPPSRTTTPIPIPSTHYRTVQQQQQPFLSTSLVSTTSSLSSASSSPQFPATPKSHSPAFIPHNGVYPSPHTLPQEFVSMTAGMYVGGGFDKVEESVGVVGGVRGGKWRVAGKI